MEFQYRAGDERLSRSPSPPTPAPSSPSASADGRPASAADVNNEARRQGKKAKICERILCEETVEDFELELEVRLDLVERFRLKSVLKREGVELHVVPPPAREIAANTSSPVVPKIALPNSHVNASATLAKRKSSVRGAASTASVETSNKKQKLSLTCTVCGITANAEKAMQDHLNGKTHRRKAGALAAQPATKPEPEGAEEEVAVVTAPDRSDDFKPTKLTMVTNAGMLNQVTQMDGYLLCEVCNVRTADRVTMMCHFEGAKHISKAEKTHQAPAGGTPPKTCVKEHTAPVTATVASTVAGSDPDTVVLEVDGKPHTVRRRGGSLLCERCVVTAPSESAMRSHLSRRKHKNKANASSFASDNCVNGGKEAAKAQAIGTAVVHESVSEMEAPLENPMEEKVRISERQDKMATSAEKDVVVVESSKVPGKETAKVSTGASLVVANAVGDSVVMEVDGVWHPLQRVEGTLLCPCCDVKATSEIVMRSHLVGKQHKNKMASTATTAGEAGSEPPTTLKAKNAAGASAAAVAPMELDAPTEVEAVIAATEPADGTTEPAGKPVTVYVEGKMFTVLRLEDGRFSCELCGARGCNKDAMVEHLYTRTHWNKVCLAEKEQRTRAAAATLVKDRNDGSPTGQGAAQVKN